MILPRFLAENSIGGDKMVTEIGLVPQVWGKIVAWDGSCGTIEVSDLGSFPFSKNEWKDGWSKPREGMLVNPVIEDGKVVSVRPCGRIFQDLAKRVDFRFCPVCGGYTPWTKTETVKTGAMVGVQRTQDDEVIITPNEVTFGAYCIACRRRDSQKEKETVASEYEEAIALKESGQRFWAKDPWHPEALREVIIGEVIQDKAWGNRSPRVRVRLLVKETGRCHALTSFQEAKRQLLDEEGAPLFLG